MVMMPCMLQSLGIRKLLILHCDDCGLVGTHPVQGLFVVGRIGGISACCISCLLLRYLSPQSCGHLPGQLKMQECEEDNKDLPGAVQGQVRDAPLFYPVPITLGRHLPCNRHPSPTAPETYSLRAMGLEHSRPGVWGQKARTLSRAQEFA